MLEIMGGEGAMAAANNSLKNNRSLLSKRKDRKALSGSYEHVEIKGFPKATPEYLMEIKERYTTENKQARITYLISFIAICLVLTGVLYAIT